MKYRMHHRQHMNHRANSGPRIIDYIFSIKFRGTRRGIEALSSILSEGERMIITINQIRKHPRFRTPSTPE